RSLQLRTLSVCVREVLGEQVERYPNMLRRIARSGHLIGNHTYDHRDLTGLSSQTLRWEIGRTQLDITRTIGHSTRWFRAPYGNVDSHVIRTVGRMGYQAINWTVDSRDWRSLSKRQIERNILSAVFPGAIILQHCSGNNNEVLTGTVQALPVIIHTLRSQGYEFVTVAQLLAPETRAVHAR
ncbi:MAG: polysaccharide deacetylase family protein, partial [Firmicutes bacterium]|nr:polysaccharide deacetylase family protein [Bacillota bacterium]